MKTYEEGALSPRLCALMPRCLQHHQLQEFPCHLIHVLQATTPSPLCVCDLLYSGVFKPENITPSYLLSMSVQREDELPSRSTFQEGEQVYDLEGSLTFLCILYSTDHVSWRQKTETQALMLDLNVLLGVVGIWVREDITKPEHSCSQSSLHTK